MNKSSSNFGTTLLFLLFYWCCVANLMGQNFNKFTVHEIDAIDRKKQNSSFDLTFLDTKLSSKRIVLLGEPTHGEGNVLVAKTNLIRHLHKKLGFTVIAFESSFYDMFMARRQYLTNRNFETIKLEIYPIWTLSDECVELFDYLAQEKEIKVVGFDNQISGKMAEFLVDSLQSYTEKNKIDKESIDWENIEDVVLFMSENYKFPPHKDYENFIKNLDDIKQKLRKKSKDITERDFWILMIENLHNLATDYYKNNPNSKDTITFKAKDSNLRDFQMAQNLFYLLNLYKDEKFICWGGKYPFFKKHRTFGE